MLGVSAGVIRRDEVFAGGAVAGYIFKQMIVDSATRATKDEVSAAAKKSGSEPRLKVVT